MVDSVGRLRAFVTVADELHFGRAATRLGISQPSLSGRVRRLESELGVRLLDRTSRHVSLTAAGQELLADARHVLDRVDALGRTAQRLLPAAAGALRIGFTGSAAGDLLPRILHRLRRRWPTLQVVLEELTSVRYERLRSGELDLVLGRLTPDEAPDLDVTVVLREPRCVVLWDGHPLAGRSSVRMRDLADDGFITQPVTVNPRFRESWLAEQHAHGLPGRITGEATSVQEFLNLTATGRGICLVPAAAARFNPWPGVTYVPVDDAEPSTISVVRLRGDRDPRTTALVQAAHAEAQRPSGLHPEAHSNGESAGGPQRGRNGTGLPVRSSSEPA